MKHYPHHIGDFDKATRHLTRIERSVYRDLIDLYYDTEQRLTLDVQALCRRIIARSNEEATAVQQVLNEFFTETPTGWYHDRCEAEIEAYRANTSQKAMAGKASAEAKRLRKLQALNEKATHVEQPLTSVATDAQRNSTNHQPINQSTSKPVEEPRKRDASTTGTRLPSDWVMTEDMEAFCKTERPDLNPKDVAARFADYWHGMAGAKGRKADWMATWRNWVRNEKKPPASALNQAETPYQRSMRLRMQEAAPESARKDPSRPVENVIDFFAIEVPAKRLEIGNEPAASLG